MQRLRALLHRLELPEAVAGGAHHALRRIARVTVADTLHHRDLVIVDKLPPKAGRGVGDELNLAGLTLLEHHLVGLLIDGNQFLLRLATEKQAYNRAEIDDFLHCFGYFRAKIHFLRLDATTPGKFNATRSFSICQEKKQTVDKNTLKVKILRL